MKKLFTAMFTLAMIISLSVLTSCGGAPSNNDVKKIIEKYDDKGELSEKEYGVLIDYFDAAMDEALPIAKEMMKAQKNGDYDKAEELNKKGEKIGEKYKYSQEAFDIISSASEKELGKSNAQKAKKLASKFYEAASGL